MNWTSWTHSRRFSLKLGLNAELNFGQVCDSQILLKNCTEPNFSSTRCLSDKGISDLQRLATVWEWEEGELQDSLDYQYKQSHILWTSDMPRRQTSYRIKYGISSPPPIPHLDLSLFLSHRILIPVLKITMCLTNHTCPYATQPHDTQKTHDSYWSLSSSKKAWQIVWRTFW